MSISYTHEKLLVAATTLATGQGELQDRLRGAYNSALIRLRSDDLPEGAVRKAFEAIRDDLTWVESKGDEGATAATTNLLDELEAKSIAQRIFDLFLEVRDLDPTK